MLNLFLDPIVLACPPASASGQEFEDYVSRLLDWKSAASKGWIRAHLPKESSVVLNLEGRYPLWDDLNAVIRTHSIDSIQPRDVVTVVDYLLNHLPTVESRLGIVDALVGDSTTHAPSDHLANRSAPFLEVYSKMLMNLCLLVDDEGVNELDQVVVSSGFSENERNVLTSGEVHDIQYIDAVVDPECPKQLSCTFRHIWSPAYLEGTIDPVRLWIESPGLDVSTKALELSLRSFQASLGGKGPVAVWRFGGEFLPRARANGFMNTPHRARELLRACAEVVLESNLAATHSLRTGAGPNDPQRVQGAYKAWRRNVDTEYRLHYWKSAAEIVFASVGVHNDFGIPNA
jgi:hypothetical protein